MIRFRVWAPNARMVELDVAGNRQPMVPDTRGWWNLEDPAAAPGVDYAFRLDGGDPLPDPRSAWQPHGIYGPSRVVDHGAFAWNDTGFTQGPLASAVIYELHTGTFTPAGTFDGAIERLDHLTDLGVTHVQLMPVATFSGTRGWGYDGVLLYAPHEAYGGPVGLKRCVDACHRRGLAVLLDVVYNHLGPAGNHLERFGPYFTDRYRTPWGRAVNLDDAGSGEVRRFLIDNALMWLRDYHIDGLRLDAVHAIFDQSAVHFLEELAHEVSALESHLGRRLVLIAESDLNDPRLVRSAEAGGYGLDAQWNDDFHHAMHALLVGERAGYYADFGSMDHLDRALREAFVYAGHESEFRQRRHGRPAVGLPGTRFVGYLQNHDQVGNRARGDRSSHLMTEGRLRIGAALVLSSPFVPMLFQGEEWAATSPFQYFTDHQDADLARAVRVGRREEFAAFGWSPEDVPDPQDEQTFRRSKLDWSEYSHEPHERMLEWHRRLITYRRKMPELTDGRMDRVETRMDQEAGWFLMRRGRVALAFNIGNETQRVLLPGPDGSASLALASAASVRLGDCAVELPPDTVAILEIARPTTRVADGA